MGRGGTKIQETNDGQPNGGESEETRDRSQT